MKLWEYIQSLFGISPTVEEDWDDDFLADVKDFTNYPDDGTFPFSCNTTQPIANKGFLDKYPLPKK